MRDDDAGPGGSALSDGLGLAPEREGQARMILICAGNPDGDIEEELGHWYSPTAVREMLAAERDRCRRAAQACCGDDIIERRLLEAIDAGLQWREQPDGSWLCDHEA